MARKRWQEELFRLLLASPWVRYWIDYPELETVAKSDSPVAKIMWLDPITKN